VTRRRALGDSTARYSGQCSYFRVARTPVRVTLLERTTGFEPATLTLARCQGDLLCRHTKYQVTESQVHDLSVNGDGHATPSFRHLA